jgi:phage FluMu gp28-like protein
VSDNLPSAAQAPPKSPVDDFIPGQLPAENLDPLADGILMQHQIEWCADKSPLKLAEKGRRTGITFAEALDSTLIAAAARSSGGDNTWYIGDTKDKGLEFVGTCARFAKHIAKELLEVEEFLFEDQQEDGSSRFITSYRIRFASGFQVAALSSNPANIRGLQGRVVIDEAAFHRNVASVIDACNALLIWGGVIRIISTHNGALNPFNELIKETREGHFNYKIHRVTFDNAVENGLYERVCLIKGWTPTVEGKAEWYQRVRKAYGSRVEAMREELDAIPREGEGVMLPLAWIEACGTPEYKVVRWQPPTEDFVDQPERLRRTEMLEWLEREVLPILKSFTAQMGPFALGEDFAMRQDRTALVIGYTAQDLHRHVPLIIELKQCPYDQQKQTLFYVAKKLPRFSRGVLDANGNGMVLAQEARQEFGADTIVELMPSDAWHREFGPRFRAAFEDRTFHIPADRDVRDDLRQIRMIGGVGKVPAQVRKEGTDGGKRHADTAVALMNFHAATQMEVIGYDYAAARKREMGRLPGDFSLRPNHDDDEPARAHHATSRFGKGSW